MYADQLLLMHRGAIAQIGTPHEVITYANLESIYGCTVLVDQSPLGPYPRITLVPHKHLKA
jgi:iron complex transport system ATP-binding protein